VPLRAQEVLGAEVIEGLIGEAPFNFDDSFEPAEEPRIDSRDGVELFAVAAAAEGFREVVETQFVGHPEELIELVLLERVTPVGSEATAPVLQ